MDLNSMGTPSMSQALLTPRSRAWLFISTLTVPFWRVNRRDRLTRLSYHRFLRLSLTFLSRDLPMIHRKFGHLGVRLKLNQVDYLRKLQLKSYRLRLKWRVFLSSLPSIAQRMYWRTTLRPIHQLGRSQRKLQINLLNYKVNKLFQSYRLKTEHRKSGEYNGIT